MQTIFSARLKYQTNNIYFLKHGNFQRRDLSFSISRLMLSEDVRMCKWPGVLCPIYIGQQDDEQKQKQKTKAIFSVEASYSCSLTLFLLAICLSLSLLRV